MGGITLSITFEKEVEELANKRPKIKNRKCVCLDISLWASIDTQARAERLSRSEWINKTLKVIVGSTKSYLTFRLLEASRQLNYAKFEAQNRNSEVDVKHLIEQLRAGR